MANTYTQLYTHIVFTVNQSRVPSEHRIELEKYITGVVRNKGQKILAIYIMPDHVHILLSQNPTVPLSDTVRDIKTSATKFIKEKGWVKGKFHWQEGFGAFSYGHSQIDTVVRYILDQENHHKKKSFREEYLKMLNKFEVNYDEKYIFDEPAEK